MINANHTKQERREVYKKHEFDTYALWKSLPSFLRGQPKAVLEKFGLQDEIVLSLLEIRTQTEFAEKFDIKDKTTLSKWNKRIEEEGLLPWINSWARKLTPNVISALYRSASKEGKASEVKAWFEIVEGM